MTPFRIVHEFKTDPATFWKLFFHEPYNVELYDRIGVKERRMLSREDNWPTVSFSVRIMPKRDLPGFLKKIVGGDLGYTETSTFYTDKNYGDCKIEPTLMRERTKIKAKYSIEPIGEGRIRRVFEGSIDISFPLVAGKIEQFIISDMTKAYGTAAEVTTEWLARGEPK
jgi:hypothetical protein